MENSVDPNRAVERVVAHNLPGAHAGGGRAGLPARASHVVRGMEVRLAEQATAGGKRSKFR